MHEIERIVRVFHESCDMFDPERGATVIAEDCHFEDVARRELPSWPEGYIRDYHRWRSAFPDGTLEIAHVIVQNDRAVGGVREPRYPNWAA